MAVGVSGRISTTTSSGFDPGNKLDSLGLICGKPKLTIDESALAAQGEAIANQDPLALELRNEQSTEAARLGFDIGMAVAEGQTLPGPGKDLIRDSLAAHEQRGFSLAVSFSVDRNRNKELAATGASIAEEDPVVGAARADQPDAMHRLGFDIATGIFGDPALGARGNTASGPGSLGIRDALGADARIGFNASMEFHLGRDYRPER